MKHDPHDYALVCCFSPDDSRADLPDTRARDSDTNAERDYIINELRKYGAVD